MNGKHDFRHRRCCFCGADKKINLGWEQSLRWRCNSRVRCYMRQQWPGLLIAAIVAALVLTGTVLVLLND